MPTDQSSLNPGKLHTRLALLREHMSSYGYRLIETGIIESADLFTTRAGDQLITRLFTFERQGEQLALRPEFTATAAYRYCQQARSDVVRWQFSGPVFLDDPLNPHLDYQTLNVGAELIGVGGPTADAEILSMALTGLDKLQVAGWQLNIGHTGLTRQALARYQLDNRSERFLLHHINDLQQLGKAEVLNQFDQTMLSIASTAPGNLSDTAVLSTQDHEGLLQTVLSSTRQGITMGGRTQADIARRLLQKRQRLADRNQVVAALDFLAHFCAVNGPPASAFSAIANLISDDNEALAMLADWQSTIDLLPAYGIELENIVVQPYLARNWEYYTGIVFELYTADGIDLGGGGRYDELVSLIGGQNPVPAVGFALNMDPLLVNTESDTVSDLALALDDDNIHAASTLASRLRNDGVPVVLLNPGESAVGYAHALDIGASGQIRFNAQEFSMQSYNDLLSSLRQALHGV